MILSVSRRTDIPNYYSEWFINRLKEGFLFVRNPMNPHQVSKVDVSPDIVDCIVFWTKNPGNMLDKLEALESYAYYFQFTLTGYGKDIEPKLPDKRKVLIPTFQKLSERIGKERVVWRYDPIFLNVRYTLDYHIKTFEEFASKLAGYTERVVISFLDLYSKIRRNVEVFEIRQLTKEEIRYLAQEIVGIAARYGMAVETCAEEMDLQDVGIGHGCCINQELVERLLDCKLNVGKDKNQRQACGCIESVEVGTYNTCPNGCKYCYANFNSGRVQELVKLYDPEAPLLCGSIEPLDKVTDRKVRVLKEKYQRS